MARTSSQEPGSPSVPSSLSTSCPSLEHSQLYSVPSHPSTEKPTWHIASLVGLGGQPIQS
eukprot:5131585-Heterocapsa_arctica.AAC.1